MNSKQKGKRGELEAVHALQDILGVDTRRTAQVDGGLSADIIGWDGVHVEVKSHKAIAAMKFLRQAEEDAGEHDTPIVLMRENGDKQFTVMVRLDKLPELCERVAAIDGKPIYPSA